MAKVKNTSSGIRVLNVYTGVEGPNGERLVGQESLRPGEERELDILDDPGVKALTESGDLSVDDSKPREMSDEERYREDPFQKDRVEAATLAGNVPGLANPVASDLVQRAEEGTKAADAPEPRAEPAHRGRPRGR